MVRIRKIFTFIKRLRIKHALYIVCPCPINAVHASLSRPSTLSRAAIQIWTSARFWLCLPFSSVQFLPEALDYDTLSPRFSKVQFQHEITLAATLRCIRFALNITSHLKQIRAKSVQRIALNIIFYLK